VKKDRGMETMLQPGNTFAVSMVPESQEKPIMKVRRQQQQQQHRCMLWVYSEVVCIGCTRRLQGGSRRCATRLGVDVRWSSVSNDLKAELQDQQSQVDVAIYHGSCRTSHPLCVDMLLLQAMTKPFEPGADRLAAVAHKDSEVSGCPIIEGANAVLDCKVVSG
jgi:flavin reductase (DIM6/NTAB) family NADH-FMN oxidoreductase RutF